MKPKVSVIVPIYNVEQYLSDCISSIRKQTLENIEIILVNDGSPDNCGELADKYAEKDNRIKVIHKKNGGLASARNAGNAIATGEYICFVDSDDWVESEMLENYYYTASSYNTDVLVAGMIIDYDNEKYSIVKKLPFNYANNKSEIINCLLDCEKKGLFNPVWNKLYKAELLKSIELEFDSDGMPGEDLLYNCEVFKNITSLVLIDDAFYHYMRRNENTLVNKYYEDYYEKAKKFINSRSNLYKYYDISENIGKYQLINSSVGYLMGGISNLYRKPNSLSFVERTNMIIKILGDNNNSQMINQFEPKNLYEKLFKKLCASEKAKWINLVYSILFFFREQLHFLYIKMRRKLLYK